MTHDEAKGKWFVQCDFGDGWWTLPELHEFLVGAELRKQVHREKRPDLEWRVVREPVTV